MKLSEAVTRRSQEKGLRVTLEKMRYSVAHWVDFSRCRNRVLDIGCGHGHLLILLCKEFRFQEGIGVDPVVQDHGTNAKDWSCLQSLIDAEGMHNRIKLHKQTVKGYLNRTSGPPVSLITACDVLHHLFLTEDLLHDNINMFGRCVTLFVDLKKRLSGDGMLLIDELNRSGLRPWIERKTGKSSVEWTTKQPPEEWERALTEAGFEKIQRIVYIPYRLRALRSVFANRFGAWLFAPRYFLVAFP